MSDKEKKVSTELANGYLDTILFHFNQAEAVFDLMNDSYEDVASLATDDVFMEEGIDEVITRHESMKKEISSLKRKFLRALDKRKIKERGKYAS